MLPKKSYDLRDRDRKFHRNCIGCGEHCNQRETVTPVPRDLNMDSTERSPSMFGSNDNGEEDVTPDDSLSQSGSDVSSTVTLLAKASGKRAGIQARKRLMAAEMEADKEKMDAEMKRRNIELQIQLEAAAAEEAALRQHAQGNTNQSTSQYAQCNRSVYHDVADIVKPKQSVNIVNNDQCTNHDSSHVLNVNANSFTSPHKKFCHACGHQVQINAKWCSECGMQLHVNNLIENMSSHNPHVSDNSHISQMIARMQISQTKLPTFNGDLMSYPTFENQLNCSIDTLDVGENEKLNILLDSCSGEAKKIIRPCILMDLNQGYREARKKLKERFGDKDKITRLCLEKITSGPQIKFSSKAIESFKDEIEEVRVTLQAVGRYNEVDSIDRMRQMITRLPKEVQNRWRREAVMHKQRHDTFPPFNLLCNFMTRISEEYGDANFGLEAFNEHQSSHTNTKPVSKKSFSVVVDDGNQKEAKPCLICGKLDHRTFMCPALVNYTGKPSDLLKIVKMKKLCFNCLNATNHTARQCRRPNFCTAGCKYKHSSLLHDALMSETPNKNKSKDDSESQKTSEASNDQPVIAKGYACSNNSSIALPIVNVNVRGQGQMSYIQVKALLDPGSSHTFCSKDLMKRLNLNGKKKVLNLETLSEDSETEAFVVALDVKGTKNKYPLIQINECFAVKKMPSIENPSPDKWNHLKDLHINSKGDVHLLIGQNVPEALRPIEVRAAGINEPYAVLTNLGWTLNGPITDERSDIISCNFVQSKQNDSLTTQVEKFWKIEDIPNSNEETYSMDDKSVLRTFDENIMIQDNHYVLPVPFKKEASLPNNRNVAEKRLEYLGRRLTKDPPLHEKYKAGIDELIQKGYAEKVNCEDKTQENVWYLPHHNVKHKSKPDKFRIVFDCSAEYKGTSLNKVVHQGPDLTNGLVGVLLRFREGKIAISADIEGMFLQVLVAENNRDSLRFLWFNNGNPNGEVECYRMTRHLFGGVWSPAAANYALKRTAEDQRENYDNIVYDTINRSFYVDDCLKSIDNEEEASKLVEDLTSALSKGGFRLTKFNSNSNTILSKIPEGELAKEVNLDQSSNPSRALGTKWNTSEDTLGLVVKQKEESHTRRGVLKILSSLYDPLGLISPVILRAKLIFQDECRRGDNWDEPIKPDNEVKWNEWLQELSHLQTFQVPRCIFPDAYHKESVQLHVFADASQVAYGAVSYIRVSIPEKSEIHTSLLTAKSRLAPIKQLTIPRLELLAAVLATKLGKQIQREVNTRFERVCYWSDSMVVLQYIKNKTKRFHTFVANRVATIQEDSNPESWNYCETSQNPADISSRGYHAQEIGDPMWLKGPEFLRQDSWPPQEDIEEPSSDDKEVKKESHSYSTVVSESTIDKLINYYSSWYKLKRAVVLMKKFIKWIGGASPQVEVTVAELQDAEKTVIEYVQKSYYSTEVKVLSSDNGKLSRSSHIYNLDPIMKNGILRVQGRLRYASIDEEEKNPIIIPRTSHVAELIVREYHERSGHSGREYILANLQKKFWIPRARVLIRKLSESCFRCKKLRKPPESQRMADLPSVRVRPKVLHAFQNVGLDCFGPFHVKRGRSTEKRYGCIFTCLCSRAVHIEKVDSLEANSFINALIRFMARRGQPSIIKCDNGTNFVGGSNELNEEISKKVQEHLLEKEIKWEFNPPAASHMGGVWERIIKEIRKVLNGLLKNETLTDESLNTLFCEVESILNNRPLTTVSDDHNDFNVITANDILLVKGMGGPPGDFVKQDAYRKQWRHVQLLANNFWKKWTKYYLPTLQLRKKWLEVRDNLKAGDVVLVVDDQLPRHKWPLARITKVFPGGDGLIRSVEIKTPTSTLVRPVHKLCLLEGA